MNLQKMILRSTKIKFISNYLGIGINGAGRGSCPEKNQRGEAPRSTSPLPTRTFEDT